MEMTMLSAFINFMRGGFDFILMHLKIQCIMANTHIT